MTKILGNNQEKTNSNVQQALDEMLTDFYEYATPEHEQRRIFGQTLRRLAGGYSVTPNEIATSLQVSPDNVTYTLRRFGAEFDQEGHILGVGLTLVPTSHAYKVNGRTLYTWCAGDALALPVILKHTASIESNDPVTGEKIYIRLTSDTVEIIEPKDAVVSFVNNIDNTNIRSSGCNKINFFSSPETASKWIARHPGTIFYPVKEVYEALKYIHENKYNDIITVESMKCRD